MTPTRRRALARWFVDTFGATITQACRLAGIARTTWYRTSGRDPQTALRQRIRALALARPRYGATRIGVLLRREGWRVNKKRVHRLYCLEGLQVRMRVRRRKHQALHRGPVPIPTGAGQRWSMDFVHDALINGRAFRVLTVVDQWSRESPLVEVAHALSGKAVAAAFEQRVPVARLPRSITVDHGTEFTSKAVEAWAFYRGVALDFTRPGKPTDNSHIESFNGRLRDECLSLPILGAPLVLAQSACADLRLNV
jgi:putative transposase